MKKIKNSVYLRYEFSDEKGALEGGDIFEFASLKEVQGMVGKILKVANSDRVAVSIVVGEDLPFYGFLGNVGINREDAEKEIVVSKPAKKTAKKNAKKKR